MRSADNIEKQISNFNIDVNPDTDRRMLDEILHTQANTHRSSQVDLWRIIMKSRITKFAAAAVIIAGFAIGINLFTATPAWAIEQTIEAMKQYNGAYLTGVCPGQTGALVSFELWVQANNAHNSTKNIVVKLDDGLIRWTRDNSTFTYIPDQHVVLVEDAVTTGFTHFLGPELLELLSKLEDARTTYGYDAATDREYAMLSGSLTDVSGAKFLKVEFDVQTKLIISIKQWDSLRPQGVPAFYASTIRYFEELPDSTFEVQIPADVTYVEQPLTVPEANLDLLSLPHYGISTEGLTREEACRRILDQLYTAVIEGDLERFKKLAPVSAGWTDDFLKNILRIGSDNATIEILEIGGISKEGVSLLGPLVTVPVTTKRQDGTVWQDKIIIQFRETNGKSSCVVHGPQGLPVQLQ